MSTRFGFVSTFPPTQCGLATFTAALRGALLRSTTDEGWVVRQLVDAPEPGAGDEVVAQLITGDSASLRRAAAQLNLCDVAIMQHEYGVYGGADGSEILHLLGQVRVPCVVVLHTVLTDPTPHQRQVLEAVIAKADAVVTMTMAARERLAAGYAADMTKVCIIAHGAPALQGTMAEPVFRTGQFTVLTWGLLGPGKGIEWGIEAMAMLQDLRPMPRYMVAGQTHPKVLLHEGDAYRDRLREQVRRAELGSCITFDGHYRNISALASLVRSADVVLLPYDSTQQVTSGVLIEAVAAGKPVVATQFPHAKELLAGGAGLLVPHRNPAAIAAALRSVITRGDVMTKMTAAATAAAPQLLWPAIARQYRELAPAGHGERGRMTAGSMTSANDVHQPLFDHLERLTDDRGLFEHARLAVPRREHGYCVDDVARGLVVVCREPRPGLPSAAWPAATWPSSSTRSIPLGPVTIGWPWTESGATRPRRVTGGDGHSGASASRPRARRRRACGPERSSGSASPRSVVPGTSGRWRLPRWAPLRCSENDRMTWRPGPCSRTRWP